MCLTPLRISDAHPWERTAPASFGTLPSLMAVHHSKVKDGFCLHLFIFNGLCIWNFNDISWVSVCLKLLFCLCFTVSLFLLHQVISWRGRRKAPPDGQNSTLMFMNRLHMRLRGWLKVLCMRWGCLPSTALACLHQVSPPNPSCQLVRIAAIFTPSFSASSICVSTHLQSTQWFSWVSLSVPLSPN